MPGPEQQGSQERASTMLKDISDEMVAIYKDHFGRGPTRVRTEWAGADTIVVLLEQTLTAVERNLVVLEEHERLRGLRSLFQYANEAQFCDPVERLTGRKVRAFLSGIDTKVDGLSTELFVLHPLGSGAVSRATL